MSRQSQGPKRIAKFAARVTRFRNTDKYQACFCFSRKLCKNSVLNGLYVSPMIRHAYHSRRPAGSAAAADICRRRRECLFQILSRRQSSPQYECECDAATVVFCARQCQVPARPPWEDGSEDARDQSRMGHSFSSRRTKTQFFVRISKTFAFLFSRKLRKQCLNPLPYVLPIEII